MKELAQMIGKQFPQFATTVTSIIFIVFLILQISDDFDKILKFISKLFDFRRYVDKLIYKEKREHYNKVLSNHNFLKWQSEVMKVIYEPLIKKKNEELKKYGASIGITTIGLGNEKKYEYESISLRAPAVSYPFNGICPKKELKTALNLEKDSIAKIDEKTGGKIISIFSRPVKRYYALVRATIRYPRRLGYMLDEIQFSDKAPYWHMSTYSSVYEHNVKTSHILEYELYNLYKRVEHKKEWAPDNLKKIGREKILAELPIRSHIHKQFEKESKECNVLTSGKYRASLLGVQAFVMIKNRSGSYDALRIRRSENVSAKPGFLQFIPSGGFEAMNDCTDFDSQWDNYSITKAIFRELLEECFGMDEDDKHASGNNASPDKLYSNENIRKLIQMLENTKEGEPNAEMALLGTSMSLVGLRQELSFILRIDDPAFSGKLISNYESRSAIHLVDINHLEEYGFWVRSEKENDLENLNCTSAGLFELARDHSIYKDALKRSTAGQS